jgi:hypothetical protein
MIEIVGNLIALHLRHVAHAHALWKILPQQAVEVLIAATLPRVIGVAKQTFTGNIRSSAA